MLENNLVEHNIIIELTETTLMDESEETMGQIKELHNLGISIALDDFGTGYSSLFKLSILPVDIIKIDKAFIKDIHENKTNMKLVKSTINIAEQMEAKVVIEGIEQLNDLTTIKGIEETENLMYQGYYFSKPLLLEKIIADNDL